MARTILAGDNVANTITAKTFSDIEALAQFINQPGANYRFQSGQFQLWDAGLSKWRAVGFINGVIVAGDPVS